MKKNNFKVLRVKAGLTQEELAKKAGKSEEYQFDSCATSLEEI